MRAAALSVLLLNAGCTHVQINSGNATPNMVTSTSAGLQVQDLLWMQRPPELAPDRTVSEQDCTKPIQLSGNLRCR